MRRWKIEDGQQRGQTMEASGIVCSVAVSQDGPRWIATGNSGKKARDSGKRVILWNAATHEIVREFTEHSCNVLGMDISHDGTKLATADLDNVQIFSIPSGDRLLPPLPHDWVVGVKFSPDGTRFATVSKTQGSSISLWDCVSHKQIGTIITHTAEVKCVVLSPSGRYLACG
ncbi:hypothetical protein M404DRAFT_111823, partial [Pisolithus tinctorius Marx 270]